MLVGFVQEEVVDVDVVEVVDVVIEEVLVPVPVPVVVTEVVPPEIGVWLEGQDVAVAVE